jgi:hypothetical protein
LPGGAGQGGEEAVDAHGVGQALAVGDRKRLVRAVAQPAHLDALLGGQHRCAERAEDVVVGGGAFAVAAVGSEAGKDLGVAEVTQPVLGAVQRAEEHLAELAAGEHAVLEDKTDDRAVTVGEPASERGELLGHAPPP